MHPCQGTKRAAARRREVCAFVRARSCSMLAPRAGQRSSSNFVCLQLPRRQLRQVVVERVVVRFVGDVDVLLQGGAGWQVEGAGGNAGGVAVELVPEEIPTAGIAEAAFGAR